MVVIDLDQYKCDLPVPSNPLWNLIKMLMVLAVPTMDWLFLECCREFNNIELFPYYPHQFNNVFISILNFPSRYMQIPQIKHIALFMLHNKDFLPFCWKKPAILHSFFLLSFFTNYLIIWVSLAQITHLNIFTFLSQWPVWWGKYIDICTYNQRHLRKFIQKKIVHYLKVKLI